MQLKVKKRIWHAPHNAIFETDGSSLQDISHYLIKTGTRFLTGDLCFFFRLTTKLLLSTVAKNNFTVSHGFVDRVLSTIRALIKTSLEISRINYFGRGWGIKEKPPDKSFNNK